MMPGSRGATAELAVGRWIGPAALTAGIFTADLYTPLGIAGGVPYVAVVLLATRLPDTRSTWIAAAGCSFLTLLGLALSPPGAGLVPTLSNRGLAIFAIWTTAFLSVRRAGAERRFEMAVKGAPYAILILDPAGRIELTNPRVKEILDYDEEELLGENVERLLPERSRDVLAEMRDVHGSHPGPRPLGIGRNLHALRKDGTEVPVEITITEITVNDSISILATVVDITQRQRDQDAIAARNEELQTLVHVTSHDLKEPLRTIERFSMIVSERHQEELDPKGQEFLERIITAARRLRDLLDDVVRIARARQPGQRSEVEAGVCVDNALARLSERIEESKAIIQVSASLPSLMVEETLATEAIYNLLSNALKFTVDGEPPHIEIDRYHAGPEEGRVDGLVVRDRGRGVPPEHADRLFALFQRGVGRDVEGTGAGLAIVRAVAEQHGGRARVRAREGGGAEFIITFSRSDD